MLCRHTIEYLEHAPLLRRSVIPREEIANWAQANQLLSRANAKANALISLAEQKCKTLREQASMEIWQRADAQFKHWERERQEMSSRLEQYATSITNQAILHLLDETVAPKRLAVLLQQLLASHIQEVNATLYCNPNELDEIKWCLERHDSTVWKLQAEDTIPRQTLVLKTVEGDFHISWKSILDFLNRRDAH